MLTKVVAQLLIYCHYSPEDVLLSYSHIAVCFSWQYLRCNSSKDADRAMQFAPPQSKFDEAVVMFTCPSVRGLTSSHTNIPVHKKSNQINRNTYNVTFTPIWWTWFVLLLSNEHYHYVTGGNLSTVSTNIVSRKMWFNFPRLRFVHRTQKPTKIK